MVYPVVADFIDRTHVSFKCPFCTKNHRHGNMLDFCSNRYEERMSHCPNYDGEFKILICKETNRKLKRRNKRKYERYLKSLPN